MKCCFEANCAHQDLEVLVQLQLKLGSLGNKSQQESRNKFFFIHIKSNVKRLV